MIRPVARTTRIPRAPQADSTRSLLEGLEPRLLLSGWQVLAMDTTGEGRYCSLAVDGNGVVDISYYNGAHQNLGYKTGNWDGTVNTFTTKELLKAGNEGLWTSLALDTNNVAHISFFNNTDNNNMDLMYFRSDNDWATPSQAVVVDSSWNCGLFSSLAVDSEGNPHIAYDDRNNGGRIEYVSCYEGTWTSPDIVAATGQMYENTPGFPTVHQEMSLKLDQDGNPHISYFDAVSNRLMYAENTTGNWVTQTVDNTGACGSGSSLVLDQQGLPHISYFDIANADLKYASYDGSNWNIETIDGATTDAGSFSSLDLDGVGNPHIAYYDATNKSLKYAHKDGSGWQYSTVDTNVFVFYGSLDVDQTGTAHIAYHNYNTGGGLKYAFQSGIGAPVPNPDLINQATLPAGQVWLPGDKVQVPVTVTNNGLNPAVGQVTVNLFASADATFDGPGSANPDYQIGTVTGAVNLAHGQYKPFSFSFTVPSDLPPGPYHLISQVTAGTGIDEVVIGNNVNVSAQTVDLAWKVGTFGSRTASAITVQDSNGVATKFALSGGGYAEITGGGTFDTITIHDTTPNSVLTISAPNGTSTSIGDITITGSLKSLVGKTVKLRGNLTVEGTIGTLILDDVQDAHLIELNSTNTVVDPRLGLVITLDQVGGCSLDTNGIPIKSLKAAEWIGQGTITAPYIGTITITGKKANTKAGIPAIRGDFEADVETGIAGGTALALKTLTVAGVVDDSMIHVQGYNSKGISIGTVKAGRVDNAAIMADGGVNSVSASQWESGRIMAGWVGSITTKANAVLGGLGNFGADLTLTGTALPAKKATLASASIAGDLLDDTQWDVQAGSVGSLTFAGTVRHSLIRSAGDISSLKLGASNGSDFGAGVNFSLLQADRHVTVGDAANAPTGTIKTFTVAGWKIPVGQSIPRFFNDSNISAKIGKLSLLNWDETGGLFTTTGGVVSIKCTDTANPQYGWLWPAPPLQASNGPSDFIHVV